MKLAFNPFLKNQVNIENMDNVSRILVFCIELGQFCDKINEISEKGTRNFY